MTRSVSTFYILFTLFIALTSALDPTTTLPTTKTTNTPTVAAAAAAKTTTPGAVTTTAVTTNPVATGVTTQPPIKTIKTIIPFTPTSIDLTTTTTNDNTIVWLTTTVNDITSVYSTAWIQPFKSLYSTIATPSSGIIGLGSLSGTVGTERHYKTLTLVQ